jgi:hypothetical protein
LISLWRVYFDFPIIPASIKEVAAYKYMRLSGS